MIDKHMRFKSGHGERVLDINKTRCFKVAFSPNFVGLHGCCNGPLEQELKEKKVLELSILWSQKIKRFQNYSIMYINVNSQVTKTMEVYLLLTSRCLQADLLLCIRSVPVQKIGRVQPLKAQASRVMSH